MLANGVRTRNTRRAAAHVPRWRGAWALRLVVWLTLPAVPFSLISRSFATPQARTTAHDQRHLSLLLRCV